MKQIIVYLILFVLVFGCTNNQTITTPIKKTTIDQKYIVKFAPSFHKSLILKTIIDSSDSLKISLFQSQDVIIFDTLVQISTDTYEFRSFGDSADAMDLIKPNFILDYFLSASDSKDLLTNLNILEGECENQSIYSIGGEDGIIISFYSINSKTTKKAEFWSPGINSKVGIACTKILEILEKGQNAIIERSAETIKRYIDEDKWVFKIISESPLYVRVLDTPCCPCQEKIQEFIMKLPKAEEIFLDITHYGFYEKPSVDVSCLENEFRKKYNHIRWIMNSEDWDKFNNLIHKK